MDTILTETEKESLIEYCCKAISHNCIFYGYQECYDRLRCMVELMPGYYMLVMNGGKKDAGTN